MRHSVWLCTASLALLPAGCSSHPSPGDRERMEVAPVASAASHNQVFDFGPILARGQTLRHDFTLTNPSEKPLRLSRATCFTPCCSAVESLPNSIPPHGESKVAVVFKPGYQSGLKAVQFAIETDSAEQPNRLLTLRARLFSEWEIALASDPAGDLPIGNEGKEVWRVVCRRKGTEGLRSPDSIKVAEPLRARFRGSVEEQVQPDGVIEATREVEVTLPAIPKPGTQQAEMALLWTDGRRKTQVIHWEITPVVHLSPSSLVIEASGNSIEQSVTIASDDVPFRITRVCGALLSQPVDVPPDSGRTHHLTLRLGPARVVAGEISTVVIGTDHPKHPEVVLRTLVLLPPGDKRGAS